MKDYGIGTFNAVLLALILYMALIFFLCFKLAQQKQALRYSDIAESFIDVELGEFRILQNQGNENEISPLKKEEQNSKETTNKAVETKEITQQASDINSLFGNIKDYQQEQSSKVQSSAQSQKKSANIQKSASKLVKQLNDALISENKQIGESSKKQMKGIYDEFLGKVSRRMQENWSLYTRSGNFSVIVSFFIDSNGIFGYTSVSKSGNKQFDAKVLQFLQDLKGKFVAYPPEGKKFTDKAKISDEIVVKE